MLRLASLTVYSLAYYLKSHISKLRERMCILVTGVAQSSSDDDNAIRYVLSVLWTTGCFYVDNIDMGALLQQVGLIINF